MKILILGAGGHAQVLADIALQMQKHGQTVQVVGFLDDNPRLSGSTVMGIPVRGTTQAIAEIPHDGLAIGIGNIQVRRRLFDELTQRGEVFATLCHPSAVIGSNVSLGAGTVVCAGVIVNTGSVIGSNVILNTASSVDHHNRIGDHAHIAPGAHLGGDVVIGAGTLIGIGATVMPQRQVGEWSIVGAGALVTRPVPDRVVVTGTPARIVRTNE